MENQKQCKCNGMNEECIICDGKGYVELKEYEIVKVAINDLDLKREEEELKKYAQPLVEQVKQVWGSKVFRKRKKDDYQTLISINEQEHLNFIGPKNPHRKTLGDTRELATKKDIDRSKMKKRKGKNW
jgi:hypothetical protein